MRNKKEKSSRGHLGPFAKRNKEPLAGPGGKTEKQAEAPWRQTMLTPGFVGRPNQSLPKGKRRKVKKRNSPQEKKKMSQGGATRSPRIGGWGGGYVIIFKTREGNRKVHKLTAENISPNSKKEREPKKWTFARKIRRR